MVFQLIQNIQKSKKSALTEATSTCQKANEIVFILKWDKNTKALNELIKTYEGGIKDLVQIQLIFVRLGNSRINRFCPALTLSRLRTYHVDKLLRTPDK